MENLDIKFEELCNWIQNNGGYINPKISIKNGKYGRSVVANEKIENENIFHLPEKLILNHLNSNLNLKSEEIGYRNCVIFSLLYEYKKPNSFWKNYLNLLPHLSEFKNHPLFRYSHGTFPSFSEGIQNRVRESYDSFINSYNYFVDYNRETRLIESFTYEEFLWSYLCTTTRMWLDIGLVPFADLLQHSNESQIILSHENGLSFMNSVGIVESGQEIYDNYATNDDINLFVTFGFVDKSSISNLLINFIFDKKEGILKDIVELRSGDNKNLHISSSGISERLMKFIRVNMINSDDLKLIDFNSNNLGEDIISLSNELRSLKKIKNRMDFFIEKSEIEYVRGNYNNHQTDTLESEICELIIKIDNLKIQVNQFINTYWINLLR